MIKTMKKTLALILALALCLSAFCVPASASDSTAAHDFPYMLFDFEDDIKFTNSSRATIVEGGMGGSGHALQIVEEDTVTDAAYVLKNKWGSDWNTTFPAGSTLQISFWVKTANPLKTLDFTLINFSFASTVGYPSGKGTASSTDWQKITISMPVTDELAWNGTTNLRFGNLGTSYNPVADGEDTTTRTYLIDDFEVKVLDPNTESDADQIANIDGYKMGFETGAGSLAFQIPNVGYPVAQPTVLDNGTSTMQVVNNPDGRGKVLKFDIGTTGRGDDQVLRYSTSTAAGNWTGYNNQLKGTIPVGATITYQFKYYWAQEMSTDNNPGFCVYDGSHFATGSGFSGEANKWHTATLSYTNTTEAETTVDWPHIRFCPANLPGGTWTVAGHTGYVSGGTSDFGDRTVYIDDLTIDIVEADAEAEPTAPVSENLIVRNDITAGNSVYFIHTLTPASTSEAGVTDASVVRLINIASDGTAATIGYAGVNQSMVVPQIPADSEKLILEVIPVSSDKKVGTPKEYPAAKSTITETTVAKALPYMLLTYEDNVKNFSAGTIVEGGMGGSGHALQMESAFISTAEPYSAPVIQNGAGSNLTGTIPAGATLKVSFWAKALTDISKFDFHLVSYDNSIGDCSNVKIESPGTTDWHKLTLKYTPTEDKAFSRFFFRGYFEGTYLMDDFEVSIVDPNAEKLENQYTVLDGFREDFEGTVGAVHFTIPSTARPNVSTTSQDNTAGVVFQIVDNPAGDGQVMKVDLSDTKRGDDTSLSLTNSNGTGSWAGNNKPQATIPVGGKIQYTFKYYWPQEMNADKNPAFGIHGFADSNNAFASGSSFETAANEWHTATMTWTNDYTVAVTFTTNMILFCAPNNPGRTWSTADSDGWSYANSAWSGNGGERTVYIDDIKVDVIPAEGKATASVSENLEVVGTVAAGNGVWFKHTYSNATINAADAKDESIISLVSYNAAGERNILKTTAVASGMNIPVIPADCTKLVWEVVPMGTDGLVGNTATYEIDLPEEPDLITETTLTQANGVVTVTAAENINNAYIIFVSYDENGKMVDNDMAIVNVTSQNTGDYSPYELTEGSYTKAMLWKDFTDCTPLAKAITY